MQVGLLDGIKRALKQCAWFKKHQDVKVVKLYAKGSPFAPAVALEYWDEGNNPSLFTIYACE